MEFRATLGELRSRFWVPWGRQVVKKVLRECVTCKKEHGRPFSRVGVDFAGPLFVKSNTGEMGKAYFALFTFA